MTNSTRIILHGLSLISMVFALGCNAASPQTSPSTPSVKSPTQVAVTSSEPRPTAVPAAPRPAVIPTPQTRPIGTGDPSKIVIVTSFPHQGGGKESSDSIVNGIRMAVEEAGGKAAGFNIELSVQDDSIQRPGQTTAAWDGDREAEIANTAVTNPDVMAYIGTYNSGAAKRSIPINNRAGLVQISPANTYPGLTKPGTGEANEPQIYRPSGVPNYVRVTPTDDLQGAVGAIWAKDLGAKTVYVLDDTELYGKGIAAIFVQESKRLGLTVLNPGGFPQGIDAKKKSYKDLITNDIKPLNPDLIYFGGINSNNAPQLWKDIREILGNKVMLMGPDGLAEKSFIQATGAAGAGTYVTYPGLAPTKLTGEGAEWYKRYKAKFNAEPEVFAVMGYESARVVLAAINKVGKKDRVAIMEAVFATRDFDGPLGKWSFDANGDTTLTTMTGAVIKGNDFEPVKELKIS